MRQTLSPGQMEVALELPHGEGGDPAAFLLAGRRVPVNAVLDRWPGADHLYLKVQGPERARYILRRDDGTGRWTLHFFEQGPERGHAVAGSPA